MRGLRGFDFGLYLKAIPLLFRHPQIMLAPLLASLANVLLGKLVPGSDSGGFLAGANSSLLGLFTLMISAFGLAVAIIVADAAWRYGRAPFDESWDKARSRGGDVVMSAFGISFVIYVASVIGAVIPVVGSIGLGLIASFFMIFALPAAAIGGIPGVPSLQVSIDRARANVVPALLATIAYIAVYSFGTTAILLALAPVLEGRAFFTNDTAFSILTAFVKAPLDGYIALILAKTYDSISYGRRLY